MQFVLPSCVCLKKGFIASNSSYSCNSMEMNFVTPASRPSVSSFHSADDMMGLQNGATTVTSPCSFPCSSRQPASWLRKVFSYETRFGEVSGMSRRPSKLNLVSYGKSPNLRKQFSCSLELCSCLSRQASSVPFPRTCEKDLAEYSVLFKNPA